MISLYVHIPFCVKKCRYCGFFSTQYDQHDADEYLQALGQEAVGYADLYRNASFSTVYIGGGTPTACSPEQLNALMSLLNRSLPIAAGAERTIEANPNSLSADHLSALRKSGINRISLGVQSFSDEVLKFLGRIHDSDTAVRAFRQARNAGFDNISIDLIYGIPSMSDHQWQETVSQAIELEPQHISAYCLSLDDGSRLKKEVDAGGITMPGDESTAAQYDAAVVLLRRAGYERYEVSNFAKPGYECRHNINYWERGEYLGLGPGAWSCIGRRRWRSVPDVETYCSRIRSGSPVIEEEEAIDQDQEARELLMLALRTSKGLDLDRYETAFGIDRGRELREKAEPLIKTGLAIVEQGQLRLSNHAFLIAHEVFLRLCS